MEEEHGEARLSSCFLCLFPGECGLSEICNLPKILQRDRECNFAGSMSEVNVTTLIANYVPKVF